MLDIQKRFDAVLLETVEEWKKKGPVKGIYVYGSYTRGNVTANSDLDVCVIWDEDRAPMEALVERKTVRIDMAFLTSKDVEDVLEKRTKEPFRVAEVVCRLRSAKTVYDPHGTLKKWQDRAMKYTCPDDVITGLKARAIESLESAARLSEREDETVSTVYELRDALFDLGGVILLKNNLFCIIRPSEILREVRMLDPLAYGLFLRAFKLKGLEEEELRDTLSSVKRWLETAEQRRAKAGAGDMATKLLLQAQREYYGATGLTFSADYELAVLEMRRSMATLGLALLAMDGLAETKRSDVAKELRKREKEYYEQVFLKYGSFDFQSNAVKRSMGEAQFITHRL